ncbi:MAG: hypothetical protein WKG07_26555 [Hymenobacter sp.]
MRTLQDAIARLRQAYPNLLLRLEDYIATEGGAAHRSLRRIKAACRSGSADLSPAQLPDALRIFQQRILSRARRPGGVAELDGQCPAGQKPGRLRGRRRNAVSGAVSAPRA